MNPTNNPNEWPKPALASLIFAIPIPPFGIVLSILVLVHINKNHLRGKGIAIAALVYSIVFTLPLILLFTN